MKIVGDTKTGGVFLDLEKCLIQEDLEDLQDG